LILDPGSVPCGESPPARANLGHGGAGCPVRPSSRPRAKFYVRRPGRDLVILGDDKAIVREAIAHVIHEEHNMDVLQADNAARALDLCKSHAPALVLLETHMPGLDTFAAAADIHQLRPQAKIAILTRHGHVELFRRARQQRLNGFILKEDSPEELGYAIRTMLRGGFYTPPSMSSELLVPCAEADPIESLTPREKSELVLCAQGYTMKEIASVLHISVKTAETHRNNIDGPLAGGRY
jgi:DNA-binding NarL/FixJ family response regulator